MVTIMTAAAMLDGRGGAPMKNPVVVVEGAEIVGVYQGAAPPTLTRRTHEHIDLPGQTLLPGLIDCHVHLNLPGDGSPVEQTMEQSDGVLAIRSAWNARRALEAGITTLRDCGGRGSTTFDVRRAFERGPVVGPGVGPRLVLCGQPVTPPQDHGWFFGSEAAGPESLRKTVHRLIDLGADFIKVIGSGGGTPGTRPWLPTYSQQELAAVVEAAHQRDRPVAVHCLNGAALTLALDAGADHVEHASFTVDADGHQALQPDVVERLARARLPVTPTLSSRFHTVGALRRQGRLTPAQGADLDRWQRMLDLQIAQVGELIRAGVQVVAGTDAGWRSVPFGSLAVELSLLCQAGLSTGDAIVAATNRAASAARLGDQVGVLAPGYRADIIAVDGDPLAEIDVLMRPTLVVRDGQVVVGPSPRHETAV